MADRHSSNARCEGLRERAPLTHVACKDTEGVVWSLPAPFRHHHVFAVMHEYGAKPGGDIAFTQGFLDSHGHYLTRKQALVNATNHDQIKGERLIGGVLTSEDLW